MQQKKYVLPNMELRIKLQAVGEESGLNWVGDFVYRRPTLRERAMIEVMRCRLNGDLISIDPDIAAYNEAISHLRWTLKETPDWWKELDYGSQLYDANIILELYNKCMVFEAEWRKKTHGGDSAQVEVGNVVQNSESATPPSGEGVQ